MPIRRTLVLIILASVAYGELKLKFPPNFKFGAASSSYQIEGAWNVSDKSPSIWDTYTHQIPSRIMGGSNGDIACDSYRLYKRDVEMAEELGLHFYRISLSWARLMPSGFNDRISEDGKRYYNDLINEILSKGIEPAVTIYHWELPQRLQDMGGWTNPLIVDWFADYAREVYTLFADRVKIWFTINEPLIVCAFGYNSKLFAPGIIDSHTMYICNKHTLLAHAKAYRIYDEEFRPKYKGEISIVNQIVWMEPESEDNDEIAEISRQYGAGLYSHPIYSKKGGWPPVIEKLMAEKSKEMGFKKSKLPPFTKEEIELVKGTWDFYAINYYTSRIPSIPKPGEKFDCTWPIDCAPDLGYNLVRHPDWKISDPSWLMVHPEGLRKQISWLIKEYGDMRIFITENGYAEAARQDLEDRERIEYLHDHLEQVLLSIYEDGVDIMGYTYWTIMDNFEWPSGYLVQFGLYDVDFNDPDRKRTPRKSAKYYSDIIKSHSLIPFRGPKEEL